MPAPEGAHQRASAAAWTAGIAATAMIAQHVAGKAARDALFLTTFGVQALPTIVVVVAVVSIAVVPPTTRLLSAVGPARLVPASFAGSAVLLAAQWALSGPAPGVAAVVLYLHVASINAILISWFWSLVNERFDPRTARRQMRTMATGAAFGGLVGGLVAERSAVYLGPSRLLLVLAAMHLVCALLTLRLGGATTRAAPAPAPEPPAQSSLRILARSSYVRDLAALVALSTIAATLIDYVFKAAVVASHEPGHGLVRFFAVFYAATGLTTFLVQAVAGRVALERLGISRTVATLPAAVAVSAAASLVAPGLPTLALLRGAETSLHSSLFRSGYELFFTPLPPGEKRRIKTVIDVAFDRVGDALGGALLAAVLFAAGASARTTLLVLTIALALGVLWLSVRLHRGYIRSLERSLRNHVIEPREVQAHDSTTMSVLRSMSVIAVPVPVPAAPREEGPAPAPAPPADPLELRIAALRSGDPHKARAALLESPLDEPLVPHAIALLAWDEAAASALEALRRVADRFPGPLVDALVEPEQEFAVRRRLPRALSGVSAPRAVDGLLRGLEDPRFEVRYRCGRALAGIQRRAPTAAIDRERVLAAVRREAAVDRGVWESQRVLDQAEDADADSETMDDFLRERANRSLEHVFTLLSLAFPRQPMRIAFQGLQTTDQTLRGTALEYLEGVLPPDVRERLWPFLEDHRPPQRQTRPRDQVLHELLLSNKSIQLHLEELRRIAREGS